MGKYSSSHVMIWIIIRPPLNLDVWILGSSHFIKPQSDSTGCPCCKSAPHSGLGGRLSDRLRRRRPKGKRYVSPCPRTCNTESRTASVWQSATRHEYRATCRFIELSGSVDGVELLELSNGINHSSIQDRSALHFCDVAEAKKKLLDIGYCIVWLSNANTWCLSNHSATIYRVAIHGHVCAFEVSVLEPNGCPTAEVGSTMTTLLTFGTHAILLPAK